MADVKRVYTFGNKEAEGNGKMRELLGGKGANLAEMNLIGIPVPPGFTITTEVCSEYYAHGKDAVIQMLRPEVEKAMKNIEKLTGMKFGDKEMPLLVSVRSGARASMPGMMDTILNLGMNDQAVEAVAKRTGNPRFAWDSYRRFVQMYGDVVLGMKPESKEDHDPFEVIIEEQKHKRGVKNDTDLTTDDLKELVRNFPFHLFAGNCFCRDFHRTEFLYQCAGASCHCHVLCLNPVSYTHLDVYKRQTDI